MGEMDRVTNAGWSRWPRVFPVQVALSLTAVVAMGLTFSVGWSRYLVRPEHEPELLAGWMLVVALTPLVVLVSTLVPHLDQRRDRIVLHAGSFLTFVTMVNGAVLLVSWFQDAEPWHPSTRHLFIAPLAWLVTNVVSAMVARRANFEAMRHSRLRLETELEMYYHDRTSARSRPGSIIEFLGEAEAALSEDPRRAAELLYGLSTFLRAVVTAGKELSNPVWRELEVMDSYLAVARIAGRPCPSIEVGESVDDLDLEIRSLGLLHSIEECLIDDPNAERLSISREGDELIVKSSGLPTERRLEILDRSEPAEAWWVHGPGQSSSRARPRLAPWQVLLLLGGGFGLVSTLFNLTAALMLRDSSLIPTIPLWTVRWVFVGVLLYPVVLVGRRIASSDGRPLARIGWVALLSIAFGLVATPASELLMSGIGGTESPSSLRLLIGSSLGSPHLWLYSVISAAAILVSLTLVMWDREYCELTRGRELLRALNRVRIGLLERSLEPHCMVNALNTALVKIRTDPDEAVGCLRDLKQLLTVLTSEARVWRVSDEMALIELFMRIEERRFGRKLDYASEIGEGAGLTIPRLLVQPIVENAVRHGMSSLDEGLAVKVRVSQVSGSLTIVVEDNGVGFASESRPGFGLEATIERLRWFYGDAARLNLDASPERGTRISLQLPAEAVS